MYENTTGNANLALGNYSLYKNTTGVGNVANGWYAASQNTTGGYNTALGYQALYYNTVGSYNVAVGNDSLGWFTEGAWNTAIGSLALGYTYTKSFANTALGYQAGLGNSTGYSNASSTWIGYQAGANIRTGSSNIALGYKAADALTTGSNNIVIGYDVDARAVDASNTLNIGNILFGDNLWGSGTTIGGRIGIATSTPWRTNSQDFGFVVATSTVIAARATTTSGTVLGATAPVGTATTTLTFGSAQTANAQGLCLKFFTGGNTIWCYFSSATLTCSTSASCE